jgi:hypothetical protein
MTSISGSKMPLLQSHRNCHSRTALYRCVYITGTTEIYNLVQRGYFLVIPWLRSKMFSLPVISPLNPVPTSNNEAMRPLDLMLPVVGAVTLDNILSKVDFLLRFLPILPKIPLYFKLISCSPYVIACAFCSAVIAISNF